MDNWLWYLLASTAIFYVWQTLDRWLDQRQEKLDLDRTRIQVEVDRYNEKRRNDVAERKEKIGRASERRKHRQDRKYIKQVLDNYPPQTRDNKEQ